MLGMNQRSVEILQLLQTWLKLSHKPWNVGLDRWSDSVIKAMLIMSPTFAVAMFLLYIHNQNTWAINLIASIYLLKMFPVPTSVVKGVVAYYTVRNAFTYSISR